MTRLLLLLASGILVQNFVMSRFLGICPFLGVSKKVETATGMGVAVTFVMSIAAIFTWLIEHFLLRRYGLEYLQTVVYILVIAALVQLVEMVIQKTSPSLYQALGVYLPLITTNCAVLGVTLINANEGFTLLEAVINSIAGALGFTLAIVLFAGIRERLDQSANIPKIFQGFPIALITAGLMALGFLGFTGLIS